MDKPNKIRVKYSKWISLSLSLFGFISLFFLSKLYLSNDFRVYFSEENPQLRSFDNYEEQFSSHDSIALIAHLDSGSWLEPDKLPLLKQYTKKMWQLPSVTRVNSLTNYQYTYADEDTLYTQHLSDYSNQPEALRKAINNDPQLRQTYLSKDETVAVIQADLEFDKTNKQLVKSIYNEVHRLQTEWELELKQPEYSKFPTVDFYFVGSVISNITLEQAVKSDLTILVPTSYLIITLGLLFFLRSIKATLYTLLIVTLSIIFTFSIFSLFKSELTPVAGFVPSVVLTLAVADCVHYLSSYRYLIMVEKKSPKEANKEAFAINFSPISLTSITTAIGVLFLNLSDSPPYRDLGNMVAIGVILAWWMSITLLPWLISRYPINYDASESKTDNEPLVSFAQLVIQNRWLISVLLITFTCISIFGIRHLTVTENWSRYFSERFEITQAINLLKDKFHRLHRCEVVLSTESEKDVHSPEYISALDQLILFLESHPKVKHIQSYGYILKQLNKSMHGDDDSYFKMPESRELAAQYLLLYELSLPEGLGINAFVTSDRTASRTSLLLEPMDSQQLIMFEEELHQYFINEVNQPNLKLEISGMDNIFAHIAHRNIKQMVMGSVVALIIISCLLVFILRSFKYGIISLIPNLIPGAIAYGIWGFSFGYIDLALSVVICMSLGIIVDDSVHFLTKYVRARRLLASNTENALKYSFHIVGRALITTTVILVAGFSTLLFSPLNPTAATGALLCLTLLIALLIDFTLLPLALYWLDKSKNDRIAG
ncbi:MAG: MMPL family transporter [Gammaproteobacteria bacterium]|nr:MMPL family transporter [Gammaproteobacteria bacterium]